jgi:hypothetical protein
MRLAASLIAVVSLSACPQERVFCENGRFEQSLTFRKDGFVIDFDRDNVIPYADRAFEACTFIRGLGFGDGEVSDDQFPKLEVLGSLGSNRFDDVADDDEVIPDDLTGFDTVTDLDFVAGIRTISGFNGVIRANEVRLLLPTGFQSLEEVGELAVSRTDGLVSLRKGGNITVFSGEGTIPDQDVLFPSLTEVVGSLEIGTAGSIVSMPGIRSIGRDLRIAGSRVAVLADVQHGDGVDVGGRVYLEYNSSTLDVPHDDQYFRDWVIRNNVRATGGYLICGNGLSFDPDSVCNRPPSPSP